MTVAYAWLRAFIDGYLVSPCLAQFLLFLPACRARNTTKKYSSLTIRRKEFADLTNT